MPVNYIFCICVVAFCLFNILIFAFKFKCIYSISTYTLKTLSGLLTMEDMKLLSNRNYRVYLILGYSNMNYTFVSDLKGENMSVTCCISKLYNISNKLPHSIVGKLEMHVNNFKTCLLCVYVYINQKM